MTDDKEHVLLDHSEFKRTLLVPWSVRKLEVKKAGKELAEIRKLNKEDEEKITEWMRHNNVQQLKIPKLGIITVEEKEQPAALKKKFLEAQLRQLAGYDEKEATDLADEIMNARPKTTKTSLKVGGGKKRKRDDS
jgi:hypothetical protein